MNSSISFTIVCFHVRTDKGRYCFFNNGTSALKYK